MSRRDYANRIVQQLCADLGLPQSELDANGRLSLHFDDILVTIAHREHPLEMLSLLIDLGELPPGDTIAPEYLLELNLHSWLRNCMTIGLDETGQQVLGHNAIPLTHLDAAGLRELLEAMLTAGRAIRQALRQPELGHPAGSGVGSGDGGKMPPPSAYSQRV